MKGYIIRLLHWNQLKSKRFLSNFILLFMTYWKRKRITCKKWNKRTNERNAWDWISFLNLLFLFRAKSWWIGTINALKSEWISISREKVKKKSHCRHHFCFSFRLPRHSHGPFSLRHPSYSICVKVWLTQKLKGKNLS